MALFYLKEGGNLNLLRTILTLIAGFVFAVELMKPDPGLTGGIILTCLLVTSAILLPVFEGDKKEGKKDDN